MTDKKGDTESRPLVGEFARSAKSNSVSAECVSDGGPNSGGRGLNERTGHGEGKQSKEEFTSSTNTSNKFANTIKYKRTLLRRPLPQTEIDFIITLMASI